MPRSLATLEDVARPRSSGGCASRDHRRVCARVPQPSEQLGKAAAHALLCRPRSRRSNGHRADHERPARALRLPRSLPTAAWPPWLVHIDVRVRILVQCAVTQGAVVSGDGSDALGIQPSRHLLSGQREAEVTKAARKRRPSLWLNVQTLASRVSGTGNAPVVRDDWFIRELRAQHAHRIDVTRRIGHFTCSVSPRSSAHRPSPAVAARLVRRRTRR
jgi:hypothetical protein